MIKIRQAIVTEGKYDKIKLQSLVDTTIVTTDGFNIFTNAEKRALVCALAKKRGIVVVTDSDRAGMRIRSFLKGFVSEGEIINVYIPKIPGREKRKSENSKENLLGVEGMSVGVLEEIFRRCKVEVLGDDEECEEKAESEKVTKTDLYLDGLSGAPDSFAKREAFCALLGIVTLPANSLLEAVNLLIDKNEYKRLVSEINL